MILRLKRSSLKVTVKKTLYLERHSIDGKKKSVELSELISDSTSVIERYESPAICQIFSYTHAISERPDYQKSTNTRAPPDLLITALFDADIDSRHDDYNTSNRGVNENNR